MLPRYRQHVARTSNLLPGNVLPSFSDGNTLLYFTFNMLPGNMLPWCKRGFRALHLLSRDRGLDSRPFHFHVMALGKLFTPKQYNLVLADALRLGR